MNQDQGFGRYIRERRRTLDLTQEELARRVGCAAITVRKIEAEDARASVQIAERLAMALGIPLNERAEFVQRAREVQPDQAESSIETPTPTLEEIGQEDLTGRAIRGYSLAERIGEGGMGAVYRAVQPNVDREVAMKIILPAFANHPDFIRRFEAEAQLVARLEHPHIVPLYDYWREPGVAYLVMRLLRGGSLHNLLLLGAIPLESTAKILEQICLALHSAHRIGVIHRDLKPGNVLLDEDANAYLADFGIAKNLGSPNLEDKTRTGALVGSPHYMSPEQIRSHSIQPQTDIYCLGVMLYEMLTGSRPFIGPTPFELIQQHINVPLPPLAANRAGLPGTLDSVIGRAAAKNPEDRYPDAMVLLEDFYKALDGTLSRQREAILSLDEAINRAAPLEEGETTNPYKGLRAFGEADAEDFFGRETLVQQLLARLGEGGDLVRFLAVVGPSGSGKSSAVKAGLIPALRRGGLPGSENWFIVDLMPGSHPFEEVEAALLRIAVNPPSSLLDQLKESERGLGRAVRRCLSIEEGVELVLVIDQFEEVFTLVSEESERTLFLNSLVSAVMDERSRMRVVITMRADFTDRPLRYVDFGELVQRRSEFVLPLNPDEMERAILGPARKAGLRLESDLLAAIIRDAEEQPGALPLLQYTLTELFEKQEARTLTKAAYREIGGILGALGRRAEDSYAQLDQTGQDVVRQLFLRLVTLGEGVEDTRRRVLRTEIEGLKNSSSEIQLPTLNRVLEIFGKARLLTFDHDPVTRGPTVEVAHEALIREWKRLREWLNASRTDVRLQRLLGQAALEWVTYHRDRSFLLRGARLDQFAGWAATTDMALTRYEQAFLDASLEEQRERETAEAERQKHEHKLEQRSRRFLGALVGMFALATLIAFILWNKAQNNFVSSERLRLASQAQIALDQGEEATLPALLALRSLNYGYSPQADMTLLTALSLGFSHQVYLGHTGGIASSTFSPDGKYVLTGSDDTTARLWDTQSGQELRRFTGHTDFVVAVFSPDGQQILTGSGDRTARLWDTETGEEILRLPTHSSEIYAVAFSPDGKYIATTDGPIAWLWDAQTGEEVRPFKGHDDVIIGLSFSPDGHYLAAASNDKTTILWTVADAQLVRVFVGHSAGVRSVAFSPDNRFLLTASNDTTARVWEIESGDTICTFLGHTNTVSGAAFSPDGSLVITGSRDKTARLWDVTTCRGIRRFIGHTADMSSNHFSPDGQYILTDSADQTVRLWDITTEIEPRLFAPSEGPLHSQEMILLMFTPDGRQILTGNGSGLVSLWDVETRQVIQTSGFESGFINAMVFSPTGKQVLTAGGDGLAVLWDSQSGEAVGEFSRHTGPVWDVAFSPNGDLVLTGSESGDAWLWDVQSRNMIYQLTGHDGPVKSVAFSPDGRFALTSGIDATARLWDLQNGLEIQRFIGHEGPIQSAVFSPDSHMILTASDDFTARLWDVESGKILQSFIGHTGPVSTAIFSQNANYVATGSIDQTVRLWDTNTGQIIRQFPTQDSPAKSLAFSPNGQFLLVGSLIEAYLWRVNLGEVISLACTQISRDFTQEERALFAIEGNERTCPINNH